MNFDNDDDSVFEQALRADLPTVAEQNRLRQRMLAAGLAAGAALGSTNVAAATQASFGASALSKLSALSWPAKLGLTALVAAPAMTLPLVYDAPVRGAELVSQVRTSAATVHARAVTKTLLAPSKTLPLAAPQIVEPALEPAPTPTSVALRAPVTSAGNPPTATLPSANPAAIPAPNEGASSAPSAVAAFDSVAPVASASQPEQARNESTLAAETQLLDRAFAALAAGDRRTASALVAEHARLFPNGLLRQERERARARLGKDPKGE